MPKVLVVDDDQEIVTSIVDFFALEGWEVASAANGQEALDVLDSSFDGAILDLRMRVMDGETTLAEIRKRFDLESLCVVILTAFGEVDSAVRTIRQGAYQYLQKPFQLPDLMRLLIAGITNQRANALRRKLLTSLDIDTLQNHICAIVTDTINPKGLYLVFLSPDGLIQKIKGSNHDVKYEDFVRRSHDKPPHFLRHILESKRYVFENDPERIREWGPFLEDARSMLAVPVPGNGEAIAGVIDIESPEENAFDRNWVEVMRHLAELAGISMEIIQKAQRNEELVAEREHWKKMPTLINHLGHHILTPVHVITLQAQTLMAKDLKAQAISNLPESLVGDITRRVSIIGNNAETIAKICDYLRDVSQPIPVKKQQCDLIELLDGSIEEYLSELDDKRIEIKFSAKPTGRLMIEADPGLIKYSIQCVVSNAIEAIERARLSRTEADELASVEETTSDQIQLMLTIDDGAEKVCLVISDTGIGIPEENIKKVFEPLFTTKLGSHLNGMGLFSARRIMNEHGGSISVTSEYGHGTTFTLCLPYLEAAAPEHV